MKHLYFVRHGLSIMNEKGIFSGITETDLSDQGIIQATKVGQKLTSYQINYIISSPMRRTKQTAEIIAQQINFPVSKIVYNKLLIERNYGPLEGKNYIPNLINHKGVETTEDILMRAEKAWELLKSIPDDNILVVGHGAIGRALRHIIDPKISFDNSTKFNNAQIVQLV